ncbi:hypothetical protein FQN54_004077 [Arachnomyces sp. PD_36]|nr:hypothetical protein FQN54_004077 [Arachnomyces sp. PD_36]
MRRFHQLSGRLLRPCAISRPPCYSRFTSTIADPTLPIPPTPANQEHHDLPSFLSYADRTSLSPSSTTYVGTHYEYTVLQSLRRFRLSLTRIGGRSDAGIDLLGTWHLPSLPHPLRVIVQCKALKTKLGPSLVRELEGAFIGAPYGWRGEGILGLLVSPREATKGVRDALVKSRQPLVWVMAGLDGRVQQVLWNKRAGDVGLEGLGVDVVYGGDASQKDLALSWEGEQLKGLDDD